MIKQGKLKYKKNFDESFYRNIHGFAEWISQKKEKEKEVQILFANQY